MTTPFSLLLQLSGISHRDAADFLAVRLDTVKSWSSGRNKCPDGAITDMRRLIAGQERTAAEALAQIAQLQTDHGSPDAIEFGEPLDDDDAQSIGWPCVGAWRGMAARVVANAPPEVQIRIVQRGSTLATQAALSAPDVSQERKAKR